MRALPAVLITAALLLWPVSGVTAQASGESSDESAGCALPLVEPGQYEGINDFEGANQAYRLVVPEGYADSVPAPLIVFLAASSGQLDLNFEWWEPYLDRAESVFVVVEQTRSRHRDPTTLIALVDQLGAEYCIDVRRVHVMGMSSSAPYSSKLACEGSDRIASFFAGIGGFIPTCTPDRPVPLISMTGDGDRSVVTRSVGRWAGLYDCDPDPLVEDLGSGVTRSTYQGCEADVVLYDVEGAAHGSIHYECLGSEYAPCTANDVFDLLVEAERFFSAHPLPE